MTENQKNPDTCGWDAIVATFEALYPNQTNPLHYGTLIPWQLGGDDPLDGISIYDGGTFYHFVTFGFSELYEKESKDSVHSGYGFELTIKLKKSPQTDNEELRSMAGVLQSIAQYVFSEGAVIRPYEYIYTGQKNGMDTKGISKLTGFISLPDDAGTISTPNGDVEFVQLVGATDQELCAIIDKKTTVQELLQKLGNSLTDYSRSDLV